MGYAWTWSSGRWRSPISARGGMESWTAGPAPATHPSCCCIARAAPHPTGSGSPLTVSRGGHDSEKAQAWSCNLILSRWLCLLRACSAIFKAKTGRLHRQDCWDNGDHVEASARWSDRSRVHSRLRARAWVLPCGPTPTPGLTLAGSIPPSVCRLGRTTLSPGHPTPAVPSRFGTRDRIH